MTNKLIGPACSTVGVIASVSTAALTLAELHALRRLTTIAFSPGARFCESSCGAGKPKNRTQSVERIWCTKLHGYLTSIDPALIMLCTVLCRDTTAESATRNTSSVDPGSKHPTTRTVHEQTGFHLFRQGYTQESSVQKSQVGETASQTRRPPVIGAVKKRSTESMRLYD